MPETTSGGFATGSNGQGAKDEMSRTNCGPGGGSVIGSGGVGGVTPASSDEKWAITSVVADFVTNIKLTLPSAVHAHFKPIAFRVPKRNEHYFDDQIGEICLADCDIPRHLVLGLREHRVILEPVFRWPACIRDGVWVVRGSVRDYLSINEPAWDGTRWLFESEPTVIYKAIMEFPDLPPLPLKICKFQKKPSCLIRSSLATDAENQP